MFCIVTAVGVQFWNLRIASLAGSQSWTVGAASSRLFFYQTMLGCPYTGRALVLMKHVKSLAMLFLFRCTGTTCTERRPPHMTSVPRPVTWRTRTRRTHTSPTWRATTACITTRPAHNAGANVDTRIQGTLIQQSPWKPMCFITSRHTESCSVFMDIYTCYLIWMNRYDAENVFDIDMDSVQWKPRC